MFKKIRICLQNENITAKCVTSGMNKNGPIIIIEDDEDDALLFKETYKKLGYINKLFFFENGETALTFLQNSDVIPFLIISDINMPKLNGFELRDKIKMDAGLQLRCIPYLFFSTALEQKDVIKAYSLSAQGFFQKSHSIEGFEASISAIMTYWKCCASPNNFMS